MLRADALGVREIAGLVAELAEQREQVHRRVVHADADARCVHRAR